MRNTVVGVDVDEMKTKKRMDERSLTYVEMS